MFRQSQLWAAPCTCPVRSCLWVFPYCSQNTPGTSCLNPAHLSRPQFKCQFDHKLSLTILAQSHLSCWGISVTLYPIVCTVLWFIFYIWIIHYHYILLYIKVLYISYLSLSRALLPSNSSLIEWAYIFKIFSNSCWMRNTLVAEN